MTKPSVCVITFVYADNRNGRIELLRECLDSIKAQNYPSYEHIIVDDGSPVDLSTLLSDYPNTKLLKKSGSGILSSTTTFNLGQFHTKADYCIYLPSDDVHCAGAINALASTLENHPKAFWAIGNAVYEKQHGDGVIWTPNETNILTKMQDGNYVNGCAVMWRNTAEVRAILPPDYTGFCSDYDFWCSLLKLSPPKLVNHNIVKYRLATDSTRNKTRSRLITSARAPDRLHYQYSKKARINLVQDRFQTEQAIPINQAVANTQKLLVTFDKDHPVFTAAMLTFARNHEWRKIDKWLSAKDNVYEKQKADILSACKATRQTACLSWNNLRDAVLAHVIKAHCDLEIVTDLDKESWLFEFLPVSHVTIIQDTAGNKRQELMCYLGMGTK